MFKEIIKMAGWSLVQFAEAVGFTKQNLNSKLQSQTMALMFLVLKTLDAKLIVVYKNGDKLDLTQFADEFEFTKRPYAGRHCKEG